MKTYKLVNYGTSSELVIQIPFVPIHMKTCCVHSSPYDTIFVYSSKDYDRLVKWSSDLKVVS